MGVSSSRALRSNQRLKRLPPTPWVGKMPWRRKWQPTPVFLPGESHGRRSLIGYSPRGPKELDTTEQLHLLTYLCLVWSGDWAKWFWKVFFSSVIQWHRSEQTQKHIKFSILQSICMRFCTSQRCVLSLCEILHFLLKEAWELQSGSQKKRDIGKVQNRLLGFVWPIN